MDEKKKVALLIELNVIGTLCNLTGLGTSTVSANGNQGKLDLTYKEICKGVRKSFNKNDQQVENWLRGLQGEPPRTLNSIIVGHT
jgi:hypothetical protein